MSEFVSGLPGAPVPRRSLNEILKTLGADVKGFGMRGTPATKARDEAIGQDREHPNAGWFPVLREDEVCTQHLIAAAKRDALLPPTEQMEQLPFEF